VLGSAAACSVTDFSLSINANRGTLAIAGGVGMVRLGHSPAKVLTPYHELVARLIAKGHTRELLGLEPSNIFVPFSKDQISITLVMENFRLVAVCTG
jgi:hypothetical protein